MARTQTHKSSNHKPPAPPQQAQVQQKQPQQAQVQQKQPQQAPENSASPATNPQRSGPTQEQIAKRAYELFLERGGSHGRHEDDWHQAERELRLGR